MAKFTCEAVVAAVNFAVNYHAQANSPAQVYHHHIFLRLRNTEFLFGQSYKARVVLNISRYTRSLSDQLRKALPARVEVRVVNTFTGIYKARHTYTDTRYFFFGDTGI